MVRRDYLLWASLSLSLVSFPIHLTDATNGGDMLLLYDKELRHPDSAFMKRVLHTYTIQSTAQ